MKKHFRLVVLSLLISFSLGAVCDVEDPEVNTVEDLADGHAIVNAFISDPTIGERLHADGLSVNRITRQVVQPGITEYVLYVHTCAMCDPGKAKKGFLTITENVRPTYMDGAIEYAVSFSIEKVDQRKSGQ